jgi:hypothetical protein
MKILLLLAVAICFKKVYVEDISDAYLAEDEDPFVIYEGVEV